MNKNQKKLMHYATTVNDVMTKTENEQEKMSKLFEVLRKDIDSDNLKEIDDDTYQDTITVFNAGTEAYRGLLKRLTDLEAPARFLGNHKLLTASYSDFVDGCQAMCDSLHAKLADLDVPAFNAAEKAQDAAMNEVMKRLQKVSALA